MLPISQTIQVLPLLLKAFSAQLHTCSAAVELHFVVTPP